jgi:hypothetical protein
MCGMDDVPHLHATTKEEILASTPPHLRASRKDGTPSLGAGAIYPIEPANFTVAPFSIPEHWKRSYGFDVGWNVTTAIFGAIDPDTDIGYLYSEHYRREAQPLVHAAGIKLRGDWIPGAIDPAARGRAQKDGENLLSIYRSLDLKLTPADNAVEAGLFAVWEDLSIGRLKVFSNMTNWLREHRLYRRDENGKIVKKDDHCMDATRYWRMTGRRIAITRPFQKQVPQIFRGDARIGY